MKYIYDIVFTFLLLCALGISLTNLNNPNKFLLIVYFLFFIWFAYRAMIFAFRKDAAYNSLKSDIESRDSKLDLNPSNIPPVGFIVAFSLICNQLYLIDNSLFIRDTINGKIIIEKHEWILYALDNFARAICLDVFETYNIHISRITSNNNLILTLVFIYKTTLTIFFLKTIINLYRATKRIESVDMTRLNN